MLRPDDHAVREIDDALRIAERSGDDLALAFTRMTLGVALVHRQTAAERDRGQQLLAEVSEVFLRRGYLLGELPIVNVYLAREGARRGDRDDAIPLMRAAVDHLFREGQLLAWGIPATGVLVETLLDRGADGDVAEARGRDRAVSGGADRRRCSYARHLAVATAGSTGAGPRRCRGFATFGIATARWRHRLATKDIWRGPTRCHDGGRSVPLLIPGSDHRVVADDHRDTAVPHREGRLAGCSFVPLVSGKFTLVIVEPMTGIEPAYSAWEAISSAERLFETAWLGRHHQT